jgi:hypothetical protein
MEAPHPGEELLYWSVALPTHRPSVPRPSVPRTSAADTRSCTDFFRANNIFVPLDADIFRRVRELPPRAVPPPFQRERERERFGGGAFAEKHGLTSARPTDDSPASSGLPSIGFFGPPPVPVSAPIPSFSAPPMRPAPVAVAPAAPVAPAAAPVAASAPSLLPAPSRDEVEAELEMIRRRRAMMG